MKSVSLVRNVVPLPASHLESESIPLIEHWGAVIVTHYVSVRPVGGSLNGKAAKVYWVSCGFEPRPSKTLFSGRAKKRSYLTS